MKHPLQRLIWTLGLVALLLRTAAAQENLPFGPSNYEHSFQLFAPFNLDLDNKADDQWSGYFFEYNKLFWSYSGERVTVGNTQVVDTIKWLDQTTMQVQTLTGPGQFAEAIFRFNPQDATTSSGQIWTLPPPPLINNTLNNVPPKAGFAMGNRYEFGYRDQQYGWKIGVLQGPELNQTQFYGFPRRLSDGGMAPFIDPDYTGPNDIGPGTGTKASPGDRAFGWGSVPVVFNTPPGYLLGFRDYVNSEADAILGTQAGPLLYVGNYGRVNEVAIGDTGIPFFRRADDINGNGVEGNQIIVGTLNGQPVLIIAHDFDDLHKFDIYFNSVTVHNHSQTDGIEAMWEHELSNNHYMAKNQNNRISVSWGARFMRFSDEFDVAADGSILGNSFWNTSFVNQIVGPQVGFTWINERQRWRISTEGRFMFGYNIADWTQNGLIGEDLIPGALNRPLYARPTAFSHGLAKYEFSPVGELRVEASYHVFQAAALKFGYTGAYVGNVRRAAPSVYYNLPDMGFLNAGTQTFLINGVDLGVEFIY